MTPNDNAQKVGVLAVMATAISHVVIDSHGMQSEYQDECATEALRSKLIEARAAVAELVEADREYDAARTAYESAAWPEVPRQQKEQAGARMVAARNRRAAALRQVEGQ